MLSVGANVLFFASLGLAVGAVARWRGGLELSFLGLSAVVAVMAMWGSGFSLAYVNWAPLLTALTMYLLLVVLVRSILCVSGRQPHKGNSSQDQSIGRVDSAESRLVEGDQYRHR
jgi:hypothetical protein